MIRPLPSWDSDATWETFETGFFHGFIRGVEVQKSADDLARYRELVEMSQPDVVIETGTRAGGSALFFHHELDLRVITIDIEPQWATRGVPPGGETKIDWVVGSSTLGSTVEYVRGRLAEFGDARVMVSLDSDHHSAHVKQEIGIWSQFVSPGCYLVIEDACFDMWPAHKASVGGVRIPEEGGTLRAINESAATLEERGFRRDEALESMFPVSHSPAGWWRRDV